MSIEFNVDVDVDELKLNPMEKRIVEAQGVTTVFEGLLTGLLQQKNPEGLKGQDRKIFNRILNKLDATENASIELECAEVDLLKSVFNDETPVPPQSVRVFSVFESRVEQAVKEVK